MLDPAMVVPSGWSGPKPFLSHLTAWRPRLALSGLLSFFRGGLLPSLPWWTQPDWSRPCIETRLSFVLLILLLGLGLMSASQFGSHLRHAKYGLCHTPVSRKCQTVELFIAQLLPLQHVRSVFLTRHLELQPSMPSSWLKWQPTSTCHLSVNPGLVWNYDKEHEFCGLCPSHSKTKWSTIPVDACWLMLGQPDCNTLQQPGLGRLLHAAAPHKGVLEVFQQGFWVNMRYFESGGTGRNNSHAQTDDNWIQDSV